MFLFERSWSLCPIEPSYPVCYTSVGREELSGGSAAGDRLGEQRGQELKSREGWGKKKAAATD